MRRFIVYLLVLCVSCGLVACGGGGASSATDATDSTADATDSGSDATTADTTAPTVSGVLAGDVLLESGTTTLTTIPAAFGISFSEAMTVSTVSTTNVSLACEASETITIAAADDSDSITDNEFMATLTNLLPMNDSCTLTIETGVTDAATTPNALAAAATYTITTPCVQSAPRREEFRTLTTLNSGATGCWTVNGQGGSGIDTSIDTTNGTASFTIGNTDFNETDQAGFFLGTLDENTLILTVKITDITGLVHASTGGADPEDALYVTLSDSLPLTANAMICGVTANDSAGAIILSSDTSGEFDAQSSVIGSGATLTTITGGEPLYLRISKSANDMTCAYRVGDTGDFTNVNATAFPIALGSAYYAGWEFTHKTGNTMAVTVDSVTMTTE